MLALWYTVLSYRDTIWDKLSSKKTPTAEETAIVCPLPPKKIEPPSKIPLAESPTAKQKAIDCPLPPKKIEPPSQIPVAEPPKSQRPLPTSPPQPTSSIPKPIAQQKKDSPRVPSPDLFFEEPLYDFEHDELPRAPSPHLYVADPLDDFEYEDGSDSSEPDDDEDSVLDMPQFQSDRGC
ncbi:unnamed protein product [Ceutorhynchus assimilis]|uniref:Uncharacterized protein n=1 Tax=Ceutorhynchus assimilis TaxID=467358 RepID=A0A9N9QP99_9CUCU|nr:unnamed protein product [Ceutorhynchus assimilis]